MAFNLKLNVNGANSGYMINRWGRETITVTTYPVTGGLSSLNFTLQNYRELSYRDRERYEIYGNIVNPVINLTQLPVPLAVDQNGIIRNQYESTIMPVDINHNNLIPGNVNYRMIGYDSFGPGNDFLTWLIMQLPNHNIITNPRTSFNWWTRGIPGGCVYKTILFYHLDEERRVYNIDHHLRLYPGYWSDKGNVVNSANDRIDSHCFYCSSFGDYGLPTVERPDAISTRIYSNWNVINFNITNDSDQIYAQPSTFVFRHIRALIHLVGNNNIIFINYSGTLRHRTSWNEGMTTYYGLFIHGGNNIVFVSAPNSCSFAAPVYGVTSSFHHLGTWDRSNALYLGNFSYNYSNINAIVPAVIRK